jgi:hypothetical protein
MYCHLEVHFCRLVCSARTLLNVCLMVDPGLRTEGTASSARCLLSQEVETFVHSSVYWLVEGWGFPRGGC